MSTVQEEKQTLGVRHPLTAEEVDRIRSEFPILRVRPHGQPLAYLDNAATSQKPQAMIDTVRAYYEETNSNVHRGVHYLSQRATEAYEGARSKIKHFINAPLPCEVVFTGGTTDGINLVAHSYVRENVGERDEILITHMEHHSNIVPWQIVSQQTGATLKVAPITEDGALDMDAFRDLITDRTKFVAVVHVSNALGTINPVKEIIGLAHAAGAPVLVDAAQAAPHMTIDVQDLGCDFLALSAHKMFGPTGFGVLYGKAKYLQDMAPWRGGGDMIKSVSFEETIYNDLPYKFEAGTPHIEGAIGLGATIDYLNEIGMDRIAAYEKELLEYGEEALRSIEGLRLIGTAPNKASVMSFVMDEAHPHDIGQILDEEGVAVRAGHHCAQPVMTRYGLPATARASIAFYNNKEDIDALVRAIHRVKEVFA